MLQSKSNTPRLVTKSMFCSLIIGFGFSYAYGAAGLFFGCDPKFSFPGGLLVWVPFVATSLALKIVAGSLVAFGVLTLKRPIWINATNHILMLIVVSFIAGVCTAKVEFPRHVVGACTVLP